ncbi:CDP-alcohol phosphatidyltransferase family protein [Lacibacter sediminis]|uniref:CDP-alcohol phosphatidyltransferase family protein n=1 Tax=Lacibacter sediminis TaxID=2760713 RepID=A0A7G5XDT6_9BACT|nr:CDP-alcohol phosphatidyltransferase family protein [Lacibacter sediminis]QNA43639.1 CDP-alcohol phosphatidyltransferase family protein [Lacibacter sediminis]
MKQIPNLFTLLNLVFGCIAIILILQPGESITTVNGENLVINLPEKMAYASFFIFAAGIVDFLDGFLARLMKASSEMGKQLDSLSDCVTFGVAPTMIMYQLLRMSYLKEETAFDTSIWFLLPAILIACGAAWRLAKFNIDKRQSISFRGVPTPITGFMVAALPLVVWYNNWDLAPLVLNRWVLYGITVLISYLMVSDLPIMSLKFKDYSFKGNQPKIILAVISISLAVVFQWAAIPLIYLTYVALSLLLRKQIS